MNGWIFALCFIWGSNWIAMKAVNDYLPPLMFSGIRFLVGAAVLFAIIFYKRIPLPTRFEWKWYAVCGLLQTTFIYGINQPAINYVQAGIVCILGFTMPFWLCLLGHFFLPGERMTVQKGVGVVIGIIGLFLVMNINPMKLHWNGIELIFELLILLGAVFWAVANIIIKTKLGQVDKFQFTAYQMGIGAIGLFILSLVFERGQQVTWNLPSVSAIVYAGVVASSLAYVLWFYILSRVDASKASITLLLVPVIGVVCMWLAFGERIDLHTLLGMILVVSGIAVVNKQPHASKRSIEQAGEQAG